MIQTAKRIFSRARIVAERAFEALKSFPLPPALGGYHCPVCERNCASFLPLGKQFTEPRIRYGNPNSLDDAETMNHRNYQCPHCNAADRDRLYALYFKEVLGAGSIRLLDVAPAAPLAAFLNRCNQIERRTADLFRDDVDDRVDITAMPLYPEGRFDAFICSHVLEHVMDDRAAMRELLRVLRPGGWGIAMVPINLAAKFDEDVSVTDEGERWRRFGQWDHVRCYTKEVFTTRLREAGFIVRELGAAHFGSATFVRCGITQSSVLYVVEKPESKNS
jgi:SAM-dependent methyltransferase